MIASAAAAAALALAASVNASPITPVNFAGGYDSGVTVSVDGDLVQCGVVTVKWDGTAPVSLTAA